MMKKLIAFILLISTVVLVMSCCPNSCQGQTQTTTPNVVTVDISKLSPEVQQAIQNQKEMDAVTQKIETYGKWAGMGKEVGIAVKDGLTAVKDVTLEIADSKLGHTVIWLVVWKVAGIDFVRIAMAFIVMAVVTYLVSKSYFRSFSGRRLVSREGFFLWPKKVYEDVDINRKWDGISNRSVAQFMHAFIWALVVGICFAIAFA